MANFAKGDLIYVSFPTQAREDFFRSAGLVLLDWPFRGKTHYLVCLIDPTDSPDPYKIVLDPADLDAGEMSQAVFIRPTYMVTVAESLIGRSFGTVSRAKMDALLDHLFDALDERDEAADDGGEL